MKMISIFLLVICALIVGCATSNIEVADPVELPGYSEQPYKIGMGDQLDIDVWNNEKVSGAVPVRPDGKISLPLVGDVLAAGMTAEELSENIAAKLQEYIRSPKVTVIVTNPTSGDFQHRVRITGAVNSPQSVPYGSGMTVLDLVLMAGGVNQFALPNKTKLYRRVDDEIKVYPVYLDEILNSGQLKTNYRLAPADIVTVPERSF